MFPVLTLLLFSPIEEHGKQWSSLWDDGNFLPWDKLCASPALEDLMAQKDKLDIFKAHAKKRALVPVSNNSPDSCSCYISTTFSNPFPLSANHPSTSLPFPATSTSLTVTNHAFISQGCGRGYDALLFAEHGYDTVGVEISGSAVREAKKWVSAQIEGGQVDKKSLASCEFILADFFEDEWLKVLGIERGCFDLVYDYAVRPLLGFYIVLTDAVIVPRCYEPHHEEEVGCTHGRAHHSRHRSFGVP
jgi:hypothetical protein